MLGKKVKKIVALLCLFSLLDTGVMTVQAGSHFYQFEFEDDVNDQSTKYYAKSDHDQFWYISLKKTAPSIIAPKKNTLSSTNIFGCKMHREKDDNVDRYHTFSNYIDSYPIEYRNKVRAADKMRLTGKKDNTSTSTKSFKISGFFAP
jgi:hypothetical protein